MSSPLTTLGFYLEKDTIVHRLPAAVKFVVLIVSVLSISIFAQTSIQVLLVGLGVVLVYLIARIPFAVALRQLIPAIPILFFIAGYHLWMSGFSTALVRAGSLLCLIALAVLLTLTTRVIEMLDAFSYLRRPLNALGINIDYISLAMSITIRFVPLLGKLIQEVRQARRARNATFSLTALILPTLIRAIIKAEYLSEALSARGINDDYSEQQ